MNTNAVSSDDLRRAQRAMHLPEAPVEGLSPLMFATLAAVARCALDRPAAPLPQPREISGTDAKRLAAGDRN